MKFLRDRSFKRLAIYFFAATLVLSVAEYFIIRYAIDLANDAAAKKDFTRQGQLESQQITLLVQRTLHGQQNLAGEITSRIDHQDYSLRLLDEGGRIERTRTFIKPLSTLPKITYKNLLENWTNYKKNINILLTEKPLIDTTIIVQAESTDSLQQTDAITKDIQYANVKYKNALAEFDGQWITLSAWYGKLIADLEEESVAKSQAIRTWVILIGVFNLLLFGTVVFLFLRYVLHPIENITRNISLRNSEQYPQSNEIGALGLETNQLLLQLRDAAEFVTTIANGKLDAEFTGDKNAGDGSNKLAESLVMMQAKLKELSDEEKKRQWANEGLTQFVEILRSSDDNIATLGDKIIAALVKYTHSNQGGLYVLNDEDEHHKFLELVSKFAFDTKKFEKQKVRLGEGILGQTFLERETTLLTEIPEDYVRITSGLGDAGPKALLMVPLKVDQTVYGIVELAAFKNYEAHEIAFVEKLGETIASTLGSVKAAQKNKHLIEQFQQQTEEMRAQEEEMRQNMEELTATQEEMSRKERDYIDRIRELENTSGNATSEEELVQLRQELTSLRQQYKSRVEELEVQLQSKPIKSDDWALAADVERSLKINLEALKITQEELNRQAGKN
jgi:hypothetical protein